MPFVSRCGWSRGLWWWNRVPCLPALFHHGDAGGTCALKNENFALAFVSQLLLFFFITIIFNRTTVVAI